MKKDNIILIGLLIVIVIIAFVCGYFAFSQNDSVVETKTDALKIKEEYASLNGVVNESNKKNYKEVTLSDTNPFVYKTEEEIVEILEKGTGILYFGFKKCPWCRSMIEVLESAAIEKNVGEIYYLDIENIRDVLSLDENNKVITEKEGSSNYYKILNLLDDHLSQYYLTSKENKKIDTKEKRLYAPTVVAVQNGEVKKIHEATVSSQKDPYTELKEEEKKELKQVYLDLIDLVSFTCSEGC